MAMAIWIGDVVIGLICIGTAILGKVKTRGSVASTLYLGAMAMILVATVSAPTSPIYDQSRQEVSNLLIKVFTISTLVANVLLCSVSFVYPVNRPLRIGRLSLSGLSMAAWFVGAIVVGSLSTVHFIGPQEFHISEETTRVLVINWIMLIAISTVVTLKALPLASSEGRIGGKIYLAGLWILYVSSAGFTFSWNTGVEFGPQVSVLRPVVLAMGVGSMAVLVSYAIMSGRLVMITPTSEKFVSSAKAKYKLLIRHAYLVEEPKPDFAFKMFTDILKGRCNECEDDDSFPCESLDCANCGLPCPCRKCAKYKSRPQGLIVTRQFASDIRKKYFIQTTPIIWLSTVQGSENMDPAKLALLTDYITNFMENSPNGVVLVDGIEYLITSNDFQRVLRAIDRWTEVAMTSKSRLIMSVDDKAFDTKELATLERDRETVRPNAKESWRIIPERI